MGLIVVAVVFKGWKNYRRSGWFRKNQKERYSCRIDAATFLAYNNIAVISGMAKGIDGYAHTACLKANGYTLASLGNGLDICYPKEHFQIPALL